MDTVELSQIIAKATCHIIIEDGEKVVSAGSGVFIEGGKVLTAKHVLVHRSGRQYEGALSFKGDGYHLRTNAACQWPTIDIGMPQYMRPISIDLAEMIPDEVPEEVVPLRLAQGVVTVGTEVLMAGFTDDIPYPLDFDEYMETMNPDMTQVRDLMARKMRYFLRPLMVKRALVGSVYNVTLGSGGPNQIKGASYILDNDLTYGGSGGPVVNAAGELVGVVTRKTTTNAEELDIQSRQGGGGRALERIFSGSGLALSYHLVTEVLEQVNAQTGGDQPL